MSTITCHIFRITKTLCKCDEEQLFIDLKTWMAPRQHWRSVKVTDIFRDASILLFFHQFSFQHFFFSGQFCSIFALKDPDFAYIFQVCDCLNRVFLLTVFALLEYLSLEGFPMKKIVFHQIISLSLQDVYLTYYTDPWTIMKLEVRSF